MMGICLGQSYCETFGGKLAAKNKYAYGKQSNITFSAIANFQGYWQWCPNHALTFHRCWPMPEGFDVTAITTDDQEIMAIQHMSYHLFVISPRKHRVQMAQDGWKFRENCCRLVRSSLAKLVYVQNISSCIRKLWTVFKRKTDMKEIFLQSQLTDLSQDCLLCLWPHSRNEVSESQTLPSLWG